MFTNAAEVERYCSLETPATELQRRLKEEALRLRAAAQPPTNAVFTHVHGEEFCAQHEVGPGERVELILRMFFHY
ncbi:hypothetical protein FJT64_012548 [Amphibalanus amphitrite]|uniref:Uncharacterized protein n=1 Tax=Amphibalanus amphitrite TaxID=1232801 RepID=A0A6A4V615_AMPAM|nr:hypothetical protein FJT64_012548 [Amphibalanus amphitrite]